MPSPQQKANLLAAVPGAQTSARKWGVPASVTLAQWIPESSWGMSKLAVLANNYFGMKHRQLRREEPYVVMPTPEYIGGQRQIVDQEFVKYANAEASFDDHGQLLATADRYAPAMACRDNPEAFVAALARGGYSTTPDYAAELLGYMRLYNLKQYDVAPASTPAAKSEA